MTLTAPAWKTSTLEMYSSATLTAAPLGAKLARIGSQIELITAEKLDDV